MASQNLQNVVDNYVHKLRGLFDLIEPQHTPFCEDDNLITIVEPLLNKKLEEVQNHVKDLEQNCSDIKQVIATRCEIIGEAPDKVEISPPYKPLFDKLQKQLTEIDQKISDREHNRAELTQKIFTIAAELGIFAPKLPSTLTDEAFRAHHAELDKLQKDRQRRIDRVTKLNEEIATYKSYLGLGSPSSSPTVHYKLDDQSITLLEHLRSQTLQKYNDRKSQIADLEQNLIHLSKVLHIDADLPPVINGAGSKQRLDLLATQLEEFRELRRQNLGNFIEELRSQLSPLWSKLCLDVKLRNDYRDVPVSEDLCSQLEHDIDHLNKLFQDPERSALLTQLQKLKVIYQKEADLQFLQEHSNDISAVIKNLKGGKIKDFIDEHKPTVLQNLRRAYHQWSLKHPDERIYFEKTERKTSGDAPENSKYIETTTELSCLLADEPKREPIKAVSVSGLKRPRPASSVGIIGGNLKKARSVYSQAQVRMACSTPVLRKPINHNIMQPKRDLAPDANFQSKARAQLNLGFRNTHNHIISNNTPLGRSNLSAAKRSAASAAAISAINASRQPKSIVPTNHSTALVNQVTPRSTIPVFMRSKQGLKSSLRKPQQTPAKSRNLPLQNNSKVRYPLLPSSVSDANIQAGRALESPSKISKHVEYPQNHGLVNHSVDDSYLMSLPSPGKNSFFDHSTE